MQLYLRRTLQVSNAIAAYNKKARSCRPYSHKHTFLCITTGKALPFHTKLRLTVPKANEDYFE